MNILTVDNKTYNLDNIPNQVDDLRYCVLDCSDEDEIDYYFIPLIFLESFYAPSIALRVGEHIIQMPLDWSIVVCDEELTELEIIPLASLNDRGFKTPVLNPLKTSIPSVSTVEIESVYSEVKWFFPKLKNGCLLAVPLENKENPTCALFVREGNKIPDLDVSALFT